MSDRPKVYIDGHVGTVGLRIRDSLSPRDDLAVLTIPDELRKNPDARRDRMLAADIAILCLPDNEVAEAVSWVAGSSTRLIDASTAHRVSEGWIYGLPELGPRQRDLIRNAERVSNPGCYPSGVVLLVGPLVEMRLIEPDTPIVVHALSGYSGGGRAMIERWEHADSHLRGLPYEAPYGFGGPHKHLPEMIKYSGLKTPPQFLPAVGPFRCGMRVQVQIHVSGRSEKQDPEAIWQVLHERYRDEPFVNVIPLIDQPKADEKTFDPQACNDTNRMDIRLLAHANGHLTLMAILDNLGKGASGAAVQNLNLMLGLSEGAGLRA